MIRIIGTVCVGIALTLDALSYHKQILKTLRTRKSAQVSSSAYLYKIAKVMFSMMGLAIYSNWVGFGMEIFMLSIYVASLTIIMKYKPKDWSLFA